MSQRSSQRILSCRFYALAASIALLFVVGRAVGQAPADAGTPNWSAYDRGQYDTIHLQNLSVSLNVPIMSKSGAFPFNAYLTGGDSYVYLSGTSLQPGYNAVPLVGVVNQVISPYGYVYAEPATVTSVTCPSGDGSGTAYKYTRWYLQFPDGTTHYLPASDTVYGGASCSSSLTDQVIDGSGWTLSIVGGTYYSSAECGVTVTSKGGMTAPCSYLSLLQDAQQTPNTITYDASAQTIKDTLGVTALIINPNAAGQYEWYDVNGGYPSLTQANTRETLKSSFGCSGKTDYSSVVGYLPTTIDMPDSSTVGLVWEPNEVISTDYTGRIQTITLRGGGTITYNWNAAGGTAAPYGLNCTYLVPTSVTRTTSDGTVTYNWAAFLISGSNYKSTTTKLDIEQNKTIYTFTGLTATGVAASPTVQALTEVQYFSNTGTLTSPTYSGTADKTVVYCYNSSSPTVANCPTATVTEPVTEVDTFTAFSGQGTNYARQQTQYDGGPTGVCGTGSGGCYGNVTYSAQYDYGATSPTFGTTTAYGSWNGSGCIAVGNGVNNKVCTVVTKQGSIVVASSEFSYDPYGNVKTTYVSPNGTTFLSNTTVNSYNANGTPSVTYDLANNPTTYAYGSTAYVNGYGGTPTNYPFPTAITKGGLTTQATYNSAGGVKLTDVAANSSNTTIYGYKTSAGVADPWWRVSSVTDPNGNEVYQTYSPTSVVSQFSFGSSVQNTTTTLDGYGRPINVQKQQGPSSANYDTVSMAYGFVDTEAYNEHYQSTNVPCTTALNGTCNATNQIFEDMLNRVVWSSTPATGEYVSTQYSGGTSGTTTREDVLKVLGPAPAGENRKQVQNEYDGLGRLTRSCKIEASGGGACGEVTGSALGVVTTTAYTSAAGSQTVSSTRGVQTRSQTYDGLGRVISSTTPEGGIVSNYYDTVPSFCVAGNEAAAHAGKLIGTLAANGNFSCYDYDALGRVVSIVGNYSGGGASCRRFYYDNSSGATGTIPRGITISNPYGRMVEAESDTCAWPITSSALITDEWFSYDKDGNMADMWELTPHSGTYYHSHSTFAGNGVPLTTQLANPSLYTMTYGLDGEGRPSTLIGGSTTVVAGTTFNAAGRPTYIDLGTGTDQSDYVYDPNTGKMTNWTFQVAGSSETGALTWNANGTLRQLAIVDGFNSAGSQTCTFGTSTVMGYDDLGRLLSDNCGSVWAQTFSYDQFDNITKSGSITWNPGYSPTTNHYSTGASYDGSGNLTSDSIHTYVWNQFNKLSSIDSSACSTNGECVTYDALERTVETSYNGVYTEIWYTQLGKVYLTGGITPYYAYWPTPGNGTVEVNGNAVTFYYMHKDWLGSARISSVIVNPTVVSDQAYAPYGEVYNKLATGASVPAQMFTGDTQDIVSGIFDTPNRELNASQGRWLSPDPVRARWNGYAYATNPNSRTDPMGLVDCDPDAEGCDPGVGGAPDPGAGNPPPDPGNPPDPGAGNPPPDPGNPPDPSAGNPPPDPSPSGPDPVPPAPIDPYYQSLIPAGCTADSCPYTVTDTVTNTLPTSEPWTFSPVVASPFYPAMNGALQAAKQATRVPKSSPPPNLVPGNQPPPQFPEDFQSDWTKLLVAYIEALAEYVPDVFVGVDPCLTNPNLQCGPYAPPEL